MAKEGQRRRVRLWPGEFRNPIPRGTSRSSRRIPADELLLGDAGTPAYRTRKRAAPQPSTEAPSAPKKRGRKAVPRGAEPPPVLAPDKPKKPKDPELARRFASEVARLEHARQRIRGMDGFTLREAQAVTGEKRHFVSSLVRAEIRSGLLEEDAHGRYSWIS